MVAQVAAIVERIGAGAKWARVGSAIAHYIGAMLTAVWDAHAAHAPALARALEAITAPERAAAAKTAAAAAPEGAAAVSEGVEAVQ